MSETEKAYDFKVLAERLKARGLDMAEEAAKIVVEETFAWVQDSAKISATPIDDMAVTLLPHLEGFVLSQVDKIDGKEG